MPEHKTESEASIEEALHAVEETPFVDQESSSAPSNATDQSLESTPSQAHQ
ncbi:MAG TPA: hypothetical protein VE710_03630 [Candidatus Bathyarchaeia archaeon]|nr:hypothetical protein [Candidatus Bathyarchaeia archaeon]